MFGSSTCFCMRSILLLLIWQTALCHGFQPSVAYTYSYRTLVQLNNNDHLGKEPVGFIYEAVVRVCNIWQNNDNFILQVALDKDTNFKTLRGQSSTDPQHSKVSPIPEQYPLYAHIQAKNGLQKLLTFYVHDQDQTTNSNVKKAIAKLLLTKPPTFEDISRFKRQGNHLQYEFNNEPLTSNNGPRSVYQPILQNDFSIDAQLDSQHDLVRKLKGRQNVTFASRLYREAHSKLYSTLDLALTDEQHCSESAKFSTFDKLSQVLTHLQSSHLLQPSSLHREPQFCHNCKQMSTLLKENADALSNENSATLTSAGSFLHLLERIRSAGPGASESDLFSELNAAAITGGLQYSQPSQPATPFPSENLSHLLDQCAAARTEHAYSAALRHLDLHKNANLDVAERFLTGTAVSCMALATSSLSTPFDRLHAATGTITPDTSHVFLIEQLLQTLQRQNWASEKLRWATQLTLGNLLRCHNILLANEILATQRTAEDLRNTLETLRNSQKQNADNTSDVLVNIFSDHLNIQIIEHLLHSYRLCKHIDCREALLVAIGNTGNLALTSKDLLSIAQQQRSRREQVGALKALKECLNFNAKYNPVVALLRDQQEKSSFSESDFTSQQRFDFLYSGLPFKLFQEIGTALINVVHATRAETTARILAGELIARYFQADPQYLRQLVREMRYFDNFELTTLLWAKIRQLCPNKLGGELWLDNWHWAPNVLNGSSTIFRRTLGRSSSVNVTYGVAMELLSKGKLLRETSFEIGLENEKDPILGGSIEQQLLEVLIFARGLGSFSGDDSDSESENEVDEEEESTAAGMSLRVLDVQLRPYTFFTGKSELMSHVWSGTGSSPTNIFRGNFLVTDHDQSIGLINGFVLEEKALGVLSLDVIGEVSVSLWNRNSHSTVTANAALMVRGSHMIVTSEHGQVHVEQRFVFGGSGRIEFITDTDFYNSPFRMCMQITQPEFKIRHNTRKYEQVNASNMSRRIHRRTYNIPAKSYPLHQDNNEMCASMHLEN